ncbi:MAG: DUF4315 family protein [Eubacteriales bacterium]|jgi:F0F1-type ATP synthase delta subunit
MSKKLERIKADLNKARARRAEWDQRIKELEQKYTEEENTEIHEVVHAFHLTPDELRELLQNMNGRAPVKVPDLTEQEAEHEEE